MGVIWRKRRIPIGDVELSIMQKSEPIFYVDADTCPVKDHIEVLCKKYNKKLIFVASFAHTMSRSKESITDGRGRSLNRQ